MKSPYELVQELRGTECQCGKKKRRAQTFCRTCYFSLPAAMRKRLYDRLGEGYEEAYQTAIGFLK